MVSLDEAQMTMIGDPRLSTIQENGQHNCFVDISCLSLDFCCSKHVCIIIMPALREGLSRNSCCSQTFPLFL